MRALVAGIIVAGLTTSFAHASGSCDETTLYKYMDDVKTNMKSLSFEVKQGNMEQAGVRVDNIIAALEKSKSETPFLFTEKGLEGDELAKRQGDYQEVMDDTIAVFKALDQALENGDKDKLNGLMNEINDQRKRGHRAFKADC
ncbi:hypothetical protein FJM67_14890 [Maribrevibacterium harenarium]|uniref:Cytochrome b562 n=1 Tax=Maribrevibacterium harenarium TaxID=2589817 RepID=A0A501WFK3_9GAMM|nr:cytochrome b562 [Maribrevibacterium harenarium]TPE47265.1 hypothetical protein FJM67_14890 [Maribrevibacterium harenarium]